MSILDKAKRYEVDPRPILPEPPYTICESPCGMYLRADDPVLLAMEEYIAASEEQIEWSEMPTDIDSWQAEMNVRNKRWDAARDAAWSALQAHTNRETR